MEPVKGKKSRDRYRVDERLVLVLSMWLVPSSAFTSVFSLYLSRKPSFITSVDFFLEGVYVCSFRLSLSQS